MGGCVSPRQLTYQQNCDNTYKIIRDKLSEQQLKCLKIIYNDLAQRDQQNMLNRQNFQLFFHKNGFWGQKLFKQFDCDQSGHISQKQFIKGIVRIFKTTEEDKIKLLYHFFEKQQQKGISFNDFVIVLYNYPKADLKQIFTDEEFIDSDIKRNIIEIRKANSTTNNKDNNNNGTESQKNNQNSQKAVIGCQMSQVLSDVPQTSAYGFKGILQDLKKKRQQQDKTIVNIKIDGRRIELKTSNIQHLVKKFAKKLFRQYNIDEKIGRLQFQNFHTWIMGHKNLYKNYYEGFHNDIWQEDKVTKKPKYTSSKIQKQSSARMQINDQFENVHLYFLNSSIIVSKQSQVCQPLYVLCLDGLAVKKIFDKNKGFGLEITHRDGIYKTKNLYLKNQELSNQWMEYLKFFKGSSAQQHYEMGQKIGTGKFSIVYACTQKKTDKQYAMKVIQSSKLDSQAKSLIAHESSIMNVLNHPLLVYFKESIQTKSHLYIITELVKGKDLFEYIKEHGVLSQVEAAKVIRQLILGVKHLHDIGIVHRDIKPQNIMISTDKTKKQSQSVKIIDFGFAIYKSTMDNLQQSQIFAGTPSYIAPEILKCEQITQKIDNFAIGAIIYFVLSSSVPFGGRNIQEMFQKTLQGAYCYDNKIWRSISLQAKDLIDKLLLAQPQARISLEQALQHQWFIKTNQKKVNN